MEAILLWGALAAVLAAFVPAGTHLVEAQSLSMEALQDRSLAEELGMVLRQISYMGTGSNTRVALPPLLSTSIAVLPGGLEIRLEHPSLIQGKIFRVQSPLPLSGDANTGNYLVFQRTSEGITVRPG